MTSPFEPSSFSSAEETNRDAYDKMALHGHVLATPVQPHELKNPLAVVDGRGWLGGSIQGWKVLCLAAGGGRHSALYAAAGAQVTVVDISDGMLELDRRVCQQYGFAVRLFCGTMTDMPMLVDNEFDLVIQPVSTCYIPHTKPVFQEVSRVLRGGGLYISQHKNPASVQSSLRTQNGAYCWETPSGEIAKPVPIGERSALRESHSKEYAHSLESILGGICRAGMTIEDLSEPEHAQKNAAMDSVGHRAKFIPPYIRIKARRSKPTQLIL